MPRQFIETVTVTREVTGPRRELLDFVAFLEARGSIVRRDGVTDNDLVNASSDYWDRQHGED